MPIVVETGTGVSGANSLISAVDLDAYWVERGDPTFGDLDPALVETTLIQAHDLFVALYGSRLRGRKASVEQALPYPRTGVVDVEGNRRPADTVPPEARKALCLLARKVLEAAGDPLIVDLEVNGDAAVVRQRQKLGDMEVEQEFARPVPGLAGTQRTYTEVEMVLAPLLGSKTMGRLVRG